MRMIGGSRRAEEIIRERGESVGSAEMYERLSEALGRTTETTLSDHHIYSGMTY